MELGLSEMWTRFIVMGILLIIVELAIGVSDGFDVALVGTALIAGGLAGAVTGSVSIMLIVAFVICVLWVLVGRGYLQARLRIDEYATNADRALGSIGIVTESISVHEKGKVKIGDEIWLAEADEGIPEGAEIVVESISGVTLGVSKVK
ncbi:MAG: NfeD family protein [Methanosarcinales archaeon]|nr:NfeD family protein [Methanosarcinales archaeon]